MSDQKIEKLKRYLVSEISRVEQELSRLRSSEIIYNTSGLESEKTAYESVLKKIDTL